MKVQEFDEFVESLQIKQFPSFENFTKIANMTALFFDEKEEKFIELNYERGLLLYLLITKFKPKNVLEIGTSAGYGTLCMAWAMHDNNIDGKIYTIDPIPNNESVSRAIDYGSDKGPHIEKISVKEIWENIGKEEWMEKIIPICGYSGEVLKRTNLPTFDFIFIDGAHFFDAVKHDFFASLKHVSSDFSILFDDYVNRKDYGIKKLIDEDISKKIPVTMIKTDTKRKLEQIISLSDNEYGMCLIQNNVSGVDLLKEYTKDEREKYISKYLKYEQRIKNRNRVNELFPVLKNIKFSFWK